MKGFGCLFFLILPFLLAPSGAAGQVLPRQQPETRQQEENRPADPQRLSASGAPSVPSPFQSESQPSGAAERRAGDTPPFDDALETPIDPDQYLLGPGDQLQIGITARTPDIYTAQVSPDGSIFLHGVGSIAAGGRTLNQI